MPAAFVQNGVTKLTASGVAQPTISGVTAGDQLVVVYGCTSLNFTTAVPTDSAGDTWSLVKTFANASGSGGMFWNPNASAGVHTLSFTTRAQPQQSAISEWSGLSAIGGTPVSNSGTSNAFTSASYTPGATGEAVVAFLWEEGVNANDAVHCTTVAFQGIGSLTDSGGAGKKCWAVNQNGNTSDGIEANAQIIASGAALTCAWAWTSSIFCFSIVAGFTAGGATINTKTENESLVVVDTLTKVRQSTRSLLEAIGIIDLLTASVIRGNGVTKIEAITVTDQLTVVRMLTRGLIETITITDPMIKINAVQASAETIALTDQLSDFLVRNRQPVDPIVIADVLSDFRLLTRSDLESITVLDSLSAYQQHFRAIADAITIIDVLTASVISGGSGQTFTRSVSEAFTLIDQLLAVRRLMRALGESISIVDALTAQKSGLTLKAIAEAITVNDAAAESTFRNRLQNETIPAIVDLVLQSATRNRLPVDSFAVIDTANQFITRCRTIAEQLMPADLLSRYALRTRAIPEFIAMLEQALAVYVPYINVGSLFDVRIQLGAAVDVFIDAQQPVALSSEVPVFLSSQEPNTLGSQQPIQIGSYQ